MNSKNPETDSGYYVNGVYVTKNGIEKNITPSGLGCPKGTRLYDTSMKQAVFFQPDDTAPGESFEIITQTAAPDILPYYAMSNYGRVMNIKTGLIMKENFRPNGYGYFCLAAENCKNGQKKYTTHRVLLRLFKPVENMDNLVVNHKDGNKTNNYVDKIMEDGTIQSNLEWATSKENSEHASNELGVMSGLSKLTDEDVSNIRSLHDQGYSYEQIKNNWYNFVSSSTIQDVCLNKTHVDPNYTPKNYYDSYTKNPANIHKLTDTDAETIRDLYNHGYKYEEIKNNFYPDFSIATISDICRGKTHNR